jgi:hypothetical protein
MKNRKFSKLSFDDAQILSREELKHVLGGDGYGGGGYGTYYATVSCNGGVGTWSYTSMPTCREIAQDVGLYCRSGSGTIQPGSQCRNV